MVLVILGVATFLGGAVALISPEAVSGQNRIRFLLGLGVCIFILGWLVLGATFRQMGPRPLIRQLTEGQFNDYLLSISPEGVTFATKETETTTFWGSILVVDATDEHLFIYTSPSTAHILPRARAP